MNLKLVSSSLGAALALSTACVRANGGSQLLRGQQRQLASDDNFDQTIPWYTLHRDTGLNPKCTGSVCGLWGDPHISSCDNRADNDEQSEFGCQVVGTVTLMKNEVYNIQGNFVPIGQDAIDTLIHKRVAEGEKHIDIHNAGATVTNDVAIEIAGGPTLQLGFGNLNTNVYGDDGSPIFGLDNQGNPVYPSEEECNVNQMYHGHKITTHNDLWLGACHRKCDETNKCKYFNWWGNRKCELFEDKADLLDTDPQEGRVLSGDKDELCGKKSTGMPKDKIKNSESKNKFLEVGKYRRCPLLFHLNGELQDISKVNPIDGYLFRDEKSGVSVQMLSDGNIPKWAKTSESIRILHRLGGGAETEIIFDLEGKGPGEMWPCAFEMNICLPAEAKAKFQNTLGLLGTPNGDFGDDLHDKEGNPVNIHDFYNIVKDRDELEGESNACKYDLAKLEYCHDTWCVESIEDLILTPAPGQDYEDILCGPIENACASEYCQLSADQMDEACGHHKNEEDKSTCRLECCHDTAECEYANDHITGVIKNEATKAPDDITIPEAETDPVCDDQGLKNTGTTACPASPLVKILHGPDLPETEEILYDIRPYAGHESERSVSFRVNNPFGSTADIYVSHEKRSPTNDAFLLPTCEGRLGVDPGCDADAENLLTIPCITHPGQHPFAVVNVYFLSKGEDFIGVDPGAEVNKCCVDDEKRAEYADPEYNAIHYALRVKCSCPDGSSGAIGDGTQAGQ